MLTDLALRLDDAAAAHGVACRLCGAGLHRILVDLGRTPLANRSITRQEHAPAYPLRAVVCDSCLLVQTQEPVPHQVADRRDVTASCPEQARRFANMMCQRLGLEIGSLVIEVGSGNGTLLRHFRNAGAAVLGIEPTATAARIAHTLGIPTEIGHFTTETAMEIAVQHGRANLVVVRNVLPEVADLFDFAAGLAGILRPKGIVLFQFPHLLPIIEKLQFDAFRHDRYSYLSLLVLERVLRSVGLRAIDAERIADHGGSLRVFACHARNPLAARPALKAVRQAEAAAGLDRPEGYAGYSAKVDAVRQDVSAFVRIRCAAGRRVAAYGATARGNTLLNTCGMTTQDIIAVADPDPARQGRFLPGSEIPIISTEALVEQRPDDVIILPWPHAPEIAASLLQLRQRGTQLWTVIPTIRRV